MPAARGVPFAVRPVDVQGLATAPDRRSMDLPPSPRDATLVERWKPPRRAGRRAQHGDTAYDFTG